MMALSVEFAVDAEDADATIEVLGEERADEVEELEEVGLLPAALVIVAAVIALGGLVNAVIRLTRAFSCGVVVDARGEIVRTRKDKNLPRGVVVVLTAEGTEVTLDNPSEVQLSDALSSLAQSG